MELKSDDNYIYSSGDESEYSDDEDGPTIYNKEDLNQLSGKMQKKKITSIKQVSNEILAYINKIRNSYNKPKVEIDLIQKVEERIILSGICYKYSIELKEGENPEKLVFVAKKTGIKTGKTSIQLVSMPEPVSIFPLEFLEKIKKKKTKNI